MNILLIANPISGGHAGSRIDRAAAWLRHCGATVEVCLTTARGDARRLAMQASDGGFDRVAVAGGDGTLNEVANGLCGSQLPVAFLPMGTVNVFALETGIPLELESACRLAVEGMPRRITLGSINGQRFLLMASVGWDAEAVARLRPAVKRRFGRLAYVLAALEALWDRTPAPLAVTTLPDGSRRTGYGVVISNARCYGGRYVITPGASLLSPLLHVALFRQGSRLALLGCALRLGLRRPLQPPAVEFCVAARLEVAGEPLPVQVDGDAWGQLPIRIESLPDALSMVLPADYPFF